MPKKLNPLVQALRGLSVLGVIIFHAYPGVFSNGYLGVNVFFVISGFLIYPRIYAIFQIDEFTFKKSFMNIAIFFSRRAHRLIPAYATMLVCSSVAVVIIGDRSDWLRTGKLAIFSLAGLANFGAFKFAGDYFHPNPNPFLHLWTLAVEEQIYIGLPVLFLIGTSFRIRIALMNKFSLLLGTFSFVIFIFRTYVDERLSNLGLANAEIYHLSYYMSYSHLWEFMLGAIAGMNLHVLRKRALMKFTKIVFVALVILIFGKLQFGQTLSVILAVLLTTYLLLNLSPKFAVRLKPLIYMGDRSYSIYLVHLPIFYLFSSIQVAINYYTNQVFVGLLALAMSLASGSLLHKFVEEKYRYK